MMTTILKALGLASIGGGIVIVVLLVILWPLVIVWALNTIFGLGIAYTFWTWLAMLILTGTFSRATVKANE